LSGWLHCCHGAVGCEETREGSTDLGGAIAGIRSKALVEKIPFSVYDFFAYLCSGVVLAATADYIWDLGLLTQEKVNPLLGIGLLVLAYVSGHVVAHFSSLIFEQTLVHKILKSPSLLLLGDTPRWRVLKWLFPN